jgi:NAD(P)-dependent dehydrogenase (short-subunit alcohol dehydrogenase family)
VALIDLYAEPLAEARELIEGAPDKIITIAADTADSGAMGNAVIGIVNRFGRLDGLIANAAVRIKSTLVSELDDEIWDRLLRVNLRGVFRWSDSLNVCPNKRQTCPDEPQR